MTIPVALLVGLTLSALLFLLVTSIAHRSGLFDGSGHGYYDLGPLFVLIVYLVGWAVPSLLGWAVYATFFRS